MIFPRFVPLDAFMTIFMLEDADALFMAISIESFPALSIFSVDFFIL